MPLRLIALLVLLAAAPAAAETLVQPHPGQARVEGAVDDGDPRVVTTLVLDAVSVDPLNTMRAGVHFEIDEGWHIYWINPGQTGLATEVTFEADGATPQSNRWPAPEVFQTADGFITSYGYSDDVTIYAEILPDGDASGEIVVRAVADYLVCADTCIPGRHEMEARVTVGPQTSNVAAGERFDASWARRARPPGEYGWTVHIDGPDEPLASGATAELAIHVDTGPESEPLTEGGPLQRDEPMQVLVPTRVDQLTVTPTAVRAAPEGRRGLSLIVELRAGPDAVSEDQELEGVLLLRDTMTTYPLRFTVPIPRTSSPE